MKKIYSFLASALALATAATASATSVTIIVDNPAAVDIVSSKWNTEIGGYDYIPLVDPVKDVNVVETNEYSGEVRAKEGYAIVSVKENDKELLYSSPKDYWEFYMYESNNGKVYTVSTVNLDEARMASVELTVDDPSKVKLRRKGEIGGDITLVAGTQTIKFDPESENQFKILAVSSTSPIYYVKHNGEDVAQFYGQYQIDVRDGDKIEIAANFPDVDYTVKVIVPEGAEGVFQGFRDYNGNTPEGDFIAGALVHAGTSLTMNINSTDYYVEDILVNGVSTQRTYWNGVIDKDYTFEIKAHAFGNYTLEIDVDDPSRVKVYNGGKYGGSVMDLVAGVNTVTLRESMYGNSFFVEPTDGNIIKSVRIVNGDSEKTQSGGNFSTNKGDKVYITSGIKEPDTKLVVWVDPNAVKSIKEISFVEAYGGSKVFGNIVSPQAGVNVFNYCYADLSMQMNVSVNHPDPIPEGYIAWIPFMSVNEEDAYQSSYFMMRSYSSGGYGPMADGDIIRLFYEQPEKANVTVTAADALAASAFRVEVDTRAASDWANMSLFKGSGVKIIPVGANIKCSVDGNAVTPDSDGNFAFTVTGDHKVALELNTSGIDDIDAEDADTPKVVYNLQGIRMADPDNLPAGIYIINGKKVAVK